MNNICIYENPYDFAVENWDGFDSLTEDQKLYLEHVNDFEEWNFCLIDYVNVYVYSRIDGTVIGKFDTIDEFMESAMSEYEEE